MKTVACSEPEPEFCAAIYDPVCDKTGKEYSNACELARAGKQLGTCPGGLL